MKKLFLLLSFIFVVSCAYKTIYVPEGDAVKLRETVKNVAVWVKPKETERAIPGKVDLQEGWF